MKNVRYLLVYIAPSKAGKTTVLRNVAEKMSMSSVKTVYLTKESNFGGIIYIEIKNKAKEIVRCGVIADGDSPDDIINGMEKLSLFSCDLVLCCAHSQHILFKAYNKYLTLNGIEEESDKPNIIFFSHFSLFDPKRPTLSEKKKKGLAFDVSIDGFNLSEISAQNIINLIQLLIK